MSLQAMTHLHATCSASPEANRRTLQSKCMMHDDHSRSAPAASNDQQSISVVPVARSASTSATSAPASAPASARQSLPAPRSSALRRAAPHNEMRKQRHLIHKRHIRHIRPFSLRADRRTSYNALAPPFGAYRAGQGDARGRRAAQGQR